MQALEHLLVHAARGCDQRRLQQRIAAADYKLIHIETVLMVRSATASASYSCL